MEVSLMKGSFREVGSEHAWPTSRREEFLCSLLRTISWTGLRLICLQKGFKSCSRKMRLWPQWEKLPMVQHQQQGLHHHTSYRLPHTYRETVWAELNSSRMCGINWRTAVEQWPDCYKCSGGCMITAPARVDGKRWSFTMLKPVLKCYQDVNY